MELKAKDDPEANGRKPLQGDVRWTVRVPLEDGTTLILHMGKKSRDMIFGMMIADCHDSNEEEPAPNRDWIADQIEAGNA